MTWLVLVCSSIHTPFAVSQEDDQAAADDEGEDAGAPAALTRAPADPAGRRAWLKSSIDAAIAERALLAGARIGIKIQDLASGDVLYERDPDGRYNIASNSKIVTSAAALSLLGPGFRMRTSVVVERKALEPDGVIRGDLYVRGGADPFMGPSSLDDLAKELEHQGIKQITGGIVVDDTYFDRHYLPPKFEEQRKSLAHYRAPIGAVSFNLNRVMVIIRPNPSGVGPAIVSVDPPNTYVDVVSQIETVDAGRTRILVSGKTKRRSYELKLTGQIQMSSPILRYKYRVPDPVLYFGNTFHGMLRRRGVRVGRKHIRRDRIPRRHTVLAFHDSSRLAVLIRAMGKSSNNYVAEMILKTIGAEGKLERRGATWEDGLNRVRRWLSDAAGLPSGSFHYENGSGLFNASQFTPGQMVKVLEAVERDFRIAPDLISSLAIAASDGTLRRRMSDGPARGLLRAKTGTLARVITLSGYVATSARRPIGFTILVNDLPKRKRWYAKRAARSLANQIGHLMAVYAGAQP